MCSISLYGGGRALLLDEKSSMSYDMFKANGMRVFSIANRTWSQKRVPLSFCWRNLSFLLVWCVRVWRKLYYSIMLADYFCCCWLSVWNMCVSSVLPILLMLLAIDIFLCNFAHHSILMYVIVSSLLHSLPPSYFKSTLYSFIAICVDYLFSLVLVGCS